MTDATLSLSVPSTFENVDRVRQAVQKLCRQRYPDAAQEPLGDLLLAVTEAMNNAVEHSGAAAMGIDVVAGPQSVVFRLQTAGSPFDPTAAAAFPDLEDAAGLPEGGFGRALIAVLTDRVAYEYVQGKNVLTIEKLLTREVRNGD